MTGEITLRGRVLPDRRPEEQDPRARTSRARRWSSCRRKNEKDLRDVPEEIRKQIKLVLVDTMDQVLETALRRRAPSRSRGRPGADARRAAGRRPRPGHPAVVPAGRGSRRPWPWRQAKVN